MEVARDEVDEEVAEEGTHQADEGRQRNDGTDDAEKGSNRHED